MKQGPDIVQAYDKTARAYAARFFHELDNKPLDRQLLERFAHNNRNRGLMADLACGPGHTTNFLWSLGVKKLVGIDLSEQMVAVATEINDGTIPFEKGNLLDLDHPDDHFGSAICFYGIVHFEWEELAMAIREVYRVLKRKGQFLLSFHAGTDVNVMTEFLGKKVQMEFNFFEVDPVLEMLKATGFKQREVVIRYPYADVEYPSQRAYILVEK